MKFISYTYPGLENVLKIEVEKRKINILEIGPGFVVFSGDISTMVKANLWFRTANKVYILLDEENIENFDKLFDFIYSIDWNYFISKKYGISVNPHIVKSKLSHIPSIQKIVQKAIFKKLANNNYYDFDEDKNIEVRIDIFKDKVRVLLDTSGEPLYKRGYKENISKAGLKETLTSGILLLTGCKSDVFCDPFCGSGTILIEKVMIDKNIAPGIFRNFLFENFDWVDKNILEKEKWRAKTREKNIDCKYFGFDIDENMALIAKNNIKKAGLENFIKIEKADFLNIKISGGTMVTNPPYNKRIKLDNIDEIYEKLLNDFSNIKCGGLITGYENIDKKFYDFFKVRILSNGGDRVKFFYKK